MKPPYNFSFLLIIFLLTSFKFFSQTSNEKQIEERIKFNTLNNLDRYAGIEFHNFIKVYYEKELDSIMINEQMLHMDLLCNCSLYLNEVTFYEGNSCTINIMSDKRIPIEELKDYFTSSFWTINEIWQEKRLK